MSLSAIQFRFCDAQAAALAYDTLRELGYRPVRDEGGDGATLHIHLDHSDLTSALEIAQAHGGQLIDADHGLQDNVFASAYGEDAVRIPAHLVNEDLVDESGSDTVVY